ncbi:MAG: tetratricopeptide repeat protein [Anaerolineae bacterium]
MIVARGQTDTSVRDQADALLEVGWLLTAILVPLWVNLWASRPFELPKAALLRSLVWLMAGVWLADCLLRRRSPWRDLRRNPLVWPALALAAVEVAATAVAVDPGLSLWGSYARAQGLLTLTSYILLFFVISARLRAPPQAWRLVGAMTLTAVPLIGLGLAQALGWRPAGLVTDARSQVFATLGRSNFLGAYLAMLLPLTLALTLKTPRRSMRLAGGALLLAEVGIIGLTLSRGAWLAAVVAVGTFGLLWASPYMRPWMRRMAVAGGVLAVLGGLAGALWWGYGQGGSIAARLTIWRAALKLIPHRPLLGYGPDTFGLVFQSVYPPQLVYYQGRGLYVDRAHNLVLDWAVSAGLLGLAAGLVLLTRFYMVGCRTADGCQQRGDRERWLLIVAGLAAVAGNVAGNLVSFDVTATATTTWLLMGMTMALAAPGGGSEPAEPTESPGRSPLRWAVSGVVLAGVILAVLQLNGRLLLADAAANVAQNRAAMGRWTAAAATGKRAVGLWPQEPQYHLLLSQIYSQQAQAGHPDPLRLLQWAEAELRAAADLRPADYRIWTALGDLYSMWGNRFAGEKVPLADEAYRRATQLAPNHALVYAAWGLADLEGGRFAGAAAKFRQAVDLDATDGISFSHLGDAELALGHVEKALAAYQEAARWEPDLSDAHLGLARCYWQLGRREDAAVALERALDLDPASPAAYSLWREMKPGP